MPARPPCPHCQYEGSRLFAHIAPDACFACGTDRIALGPTPPPVAARPTRWFQRNGSRMGPYLVAFGGRVHARDREVRLYPTPAGLQVELYAVEWVTGRAAARRADPFDPVYLLLHAGIVHTATEIAWVATKYTDDARRPAAPEGPDAALVTQGLARALAAGAVPRSPPSASRAARGTLRVRRSP